MENINSLKKEIIEIERQIERLNNLKEGLNNRILTFQKIEEKIENEKFKNEVWKDVIDYEGLYSVSNFGRIKNLLTNKILLQGVELNGYLQSSLRKNDKSKTFTVHRIVAKAFVDNPKNKYCVNHIDGNKQNNNSINLEWVTASENVKHAYKNGLYKKTKNTKTTKEDVLLARSMYQSGIFTQNEIAEQLNINRTTVVRIVNNELWQSVNQNEFKDLISY